MSEKNYKQCCDGCKISRGEEKRIILLKGDWVLNHYGGEEGFLGWLALQPKYHLMEISELCDEQAKYLGIHLKNIIKLLKS